MASLGALGLGLVAGWASGFIGWSWRGLAFKSLILGAVAGSVVNLVPNALLLGCFATASGILAHETLLDAIRRRARNELG